MSTKLKTDDLVIKQMIEDLPFDEIPTTDDTLPAEIKNMIENVSKK